MEPRPPALRVKSLSHWTTRKSLVALNFILAFGKGIMAIAGEWGWGTHLP